MTGLHATDIPFQSNAEVPEGWRLLNDAELMRLDDPQFLITNILPRRGVGVLYGPSGSCKTTMVAGMLVSLATGAPWFGHEVCHPGSSIYVAAEDIAGFKIRLKAAKLAAGLPLNRPVGVHTFPEPIDLRDSIDVSRFIRFVRATNLKLEQVTLDTFAASTPGASENSSEDMTASMSAAQKIRDELDCGVLIVHHTNASGSRERGHSAMRGAADLMIAVNPVDDIIHFECSKLRNGPPFAPMSLKLTNIAEGGCVLRLASDVSPKFGMSPAQDKVLTVLRETFAADGATKKEWRSACVDVPERTFHRVAKVLKEGGLVRQSGTRFTVAKRDR